MAAVLNQPDNINFLSPFGFRFVIKRMPNVVFFCTDVNIPSVSISGINIPTPHKNFPIYGNKLEYGNLRVTFRVDENFQNYLEIYNWLQNMTHPESFNQFNQLSGPMNNTGDSALSDATVTILNSSMAPNAEFQFEDIFPMSISELNFTATDGDVNYISASVDFGFKLFKVNVL
jgi:hypothetical protein